MIHIGSIIKEKFDELGLPVSWFAKELCCDRTNVYSIFKRESIDTSLLVKISIILNHDFFRYYSDNLGINADK
ncbi:MAG: XRE family transcriptional regulator [Bacteroidaceae bacterium]|nr:XRE family transcriptional regulator [Bacteroidaceae bacterium]MBR4066073.1 XRE family transcriptional regulator [Bacteroidaceae bacterium]